MLGSYVDNTGVDVDVDVDVGVDEWDFFRLGNSRVSVLR